MIWDYKHSWKVQKISVMLKGKNLYFSHAFYNKTTIKNGSYGVDWWLNVSIQEWSSLEWTGRKLLPMGKKIFGNE